MQRRIGQSMEILVIYWLPIAMVPCLYQCNLYIKRMLRVWRAQKCIFIDSAKTAPPGTGQKNTLCHAVPYWDSNGNFRIFGATYHHGTGFAPMQRLC